MIREDILNEAKKVICGERQDSYGSPKDNFSKIAKLWSTYIGREITEIDVANMMILLKISRGKSGKYKADNFVDICGYAALAAEVGEVQIKGD